MSEAVEVRATALSKMGYRRTLDSDWHQITITITIVRWLHPLVLCIIGSYGRAPSAHGTGDRGHYSMYIPSVTNVDDVMRMLNYWGSHSLEVMRKVVCTKMPGAWNHNLKVLNIQLKIKHTKGGLITISRHIAVIQEILAPSVPWYSAIGDDANC